jgi:hypothetical protein
MKRGEKIRLFFLELSYTFNSKNKATTKPTIRSIEGSLRKNATQESNRENKLSLLSEINSYFLHEKLDIKLNIARRLK